MGLTNVELIQLVNKWRRKASDVEMGSQMGALSHARNVGYAEGLRDCAENLREVIAGIVVDAQDTSEPRPPSQVLDSQQLSEATRDLRERLLKPRPDPDEEAA